MEDKIKKIIRKLAVISFLLVCFSFGANAKAATLFFSPSSASCGVGGNVSLNVNVGSADQAMNAASAVISFPPDKLEVSSISKNGSICSLWVQQPSFSNEKGTINFEGVVFNPGYSGASGKIITINFKAKTVGTAPLSISSALVLANDGAGTNILSGLGKASINITAATTKSKEEDTTSKKTAGTPLAVTISSPTHPDQNKWYNNNNPKFEWVMSKDITAINVLADKNPDTNPGTKSDGLSNSYDFENVDDGVWYFHLRLKNSAGWGEVSHFKFQIDKKALEYLNITEVKEEGNILPQAKFSFAASETISGIDYYEIKIDNGEKEIWRQKADELYVTPAIGAGEHELFVTAFNKAGNSIKNSAKFFIEASVAPEIIGYFCAQADNKISTIENDQVFVKNNCILSRGDTLIVKGKSNYPSQQVIVYLQKDDEEVITATIKSDCEGNFIFIANNKLKNGVYQVWAEIISDNNIKSAASKKVSITVKRYVLSKILLAMDIFGMLSSFIIFVTFLIIIFWYIWHKFCIFRKKAKKEDYEVDHELYKSFVLFRKDADEQIEKLEKTRAERQLTKEEEEILKNLKKK
ncbi:MAG: cohesin domain-containing protein [Patescibacteria group bacterium]|jgi:hypothetical protein